MGSFCLLGFQKKNDLQNHSQYAGPLDFLGIFVGTSQKVVFLFQCGNLWSNLRIGKQSAQRSGQEEATKRQRRVIQLSLGSNEASTFGGWYLGSSNDCCCEEPPLGLPDVASVTLNPFERRFLNLKYATFFFEECR